MEQTTGTITKRLEAAIVAISEHCGMQKSCLDCGLYNGGACALCCGSPATWAAEVRRLIAAHDHGKDG